MQPMIEMLPKELRDWVGGGFSIRDMRFSVARSAHKVTIEKGYNDLKASVLSQLVGS